VTDEDKTKEQLIAELIKLRQENMELKLSPKDQERIYPVSAWSSPSQWFSTGRNEMFVTNPSEQQQEVNPPMDYLFSDLVDIPLLQQLLNSFYMATGIPHGLIDQDNNIQSGIGWQDICTQFHRVCPQTECRCKQSDSYIAAYLHDGPYVGYKCMNGLVDYGTPIIVEGQHVATIFLGQFLHELPDEEFFRRQAQEYGFDEAAYMEALRRVPVIPKEQVESIMRFYSQLGQFFATMGLERKRQLESAEQKFTKAFHCNPAPITITTLMEGRYVDVNEAWLENTGYTRTEAIGSTCTELGIWLSQAERDIMIKQLSEHGRIRRHNAKFRTKYGTIRDYLVSGEIVEINHQPHLLCVHSDITELKCLMEALHQSEEKFSKAFHGNPIMMTLASVEEGRIIDVNEAFCSATGYSREEVINHPSKDINYFVNFEEWKQRKTIVTDEGQIKGTEVDFLTKTGEIRHSIYWTQLIHFDDDNCHITCLIDITEQKRTEKQIRLNHQRMEALEKLNQMTNATTKEITEFAHQEAINLTGSDIGFLGFINEDETEMNVFGWSDNVMEMCTVANESLTFIVTDSGLWAEVIRQRHPIIVNDYSASHPHKKGVPEGHVDLLRLLVVPVFEDGHIVAVISVANKKEDYDESDIRQLNLLIGAVWKIIQHRETVAAIRQSEEKFSKAFHGMPIIMALATIEEGRFIDANEALYSGSGFTQEEIIGHTSLELSLFTRSVRSDLIASLMKEGRLDNYEVDLCTKSGEMRNCLCWGQLIHINSELCHITAVIDVTEQRRVENELARLERLNLISEMAVSMSSHFEEKLQIATEETRQELVRFKEAFSRAVGLERIIINSVNMKKTFLLATKMHEDRKVPVLIEGETGTGKEVIAKYIHYGNGNVATPFIALNCAAIAPSLFESELFGYEAGAFTGGLSKGQKGKLDMANGGTLFLDEISELPVELQAKLLRFLQENEFFRVGGLKAVKTDVRIICATNQNIEIIVAAGKFRQDLYYRLNVGRIYLPPLRERVEDILPLAYSFLNTFAEEKGSKSRAISKEAGEILESYDWPGNVREVKNAMQRVILLWDDWEVKPQHLNFLNRNRSDQPENSKSPSMLDLSDIVLPADKLPIEDVYNAIVKKALELNNGNKTKTAQYLHISRNSLMYRLKQIDQNPN